MPSEQSYKSHRHNAVPTLVAYLLGIFALAWFLSPSLRNRSLVPGLVLLALAVLVLAYISRAYTVRLQDRIIKLEMHNRCRDLIGPQGTVALSKLTRGQIVALRFASDEELPALLDRATRESLSKDDIKRAIKQWRPDWDRT